MAKIPVGRTIAYAYGFTFGHFFTILGLSWFPLLIVAGVGYLAVPRYFNAMQDLIANQDISGFGVAMGSMLLFIVVMLTCFAMIYVAVTRQALGLRHGFAVFYFSLDRAFWALVGGYLLFMLIYLGVAIGLGIAVGIVLAVLSAAGGVVAAAIGGALVAIFVFFFVIYSIFRVMFLMAPVAVAEEHHVLRRSWQLAGGNFWRIFVVLLGIVIPFFVVEIFALIIVGAVMGANLIMLAPPRDDASPEQMLMFFRMLMGQFGLALPLLAPVALVLYVIGIGLFTSAQAFAYRALVPVNDAPATASPR